MRRATWAVLAAVGVVLACPVLADDPPAAGGESASQDAAGEARGAVAAGADEEVRAGAGSMEPADAEPAMTSEEQAEQRFAENVWTSP